MSNRTTTFAKQLQPLVDRARPRIEKTTTQLSGVVDHVRPIVTSVTTLGWTVVFLFVAAWVFGAALGWKELLYLAGACFVLMVIGAGFVLGPFTLEVDVVLDAKRVSVGDSCAGAVKVTNRSQRRSLPLSVELQVGEGLLQLDVPSMESGQSSEEIFVVRTERRGIISIGPAQVVRRDPVGVLARRATSGTALELIVHPRVTALEPFGAGILRDLEGFTTNEISQSDLAFHSIREYEPGDDRRQVHWRSTAKTGKLQVRQFLDTRRSNLLVVVDTRPENYADDEEFELALEVAGSLTSCAARNDLYSVLVVGGHGYSGVVAHEFLDTLARANGDENGTNLPQVVGRAHRSDTTLAFLVSGSLATPALLYASASRLSADTKVTAIRVQPGGNASLSTTDRLVLVQLGTLRDLRATSRLLAI